LWPVCRAMRVPEKNLLWKKRGSDVVFSKLRCKHHPPDRRWYCARRTARQPELDLSFTIELVETARRYQPALSLNSFFSRPEPSVPIKSCASVIAGGDPHARTGTCKRSAYRDASARGTNTSTSLRTLCPTRQSIWLGTRRLAPSRRGNFTSPRGSHPRRVISGRGNKATSSYRPFRLPGTTCRIVPNLISRRQPWEESTGPG
jgi:hypothetical protein